MLTPTTWCNQIKGTYLQALAVRADGTCERVTEEVKKAAEKKKNVMGYIQTIGKCLFWTALVLGACGFVIPMALFNYMRHEVAIGEFGDMEPM
jgi:cation transport ATPase